MIRPDLMKDVAELVELERSECLSLLAQGEVGRVVFTEAAMPAAHPVNYLLDGEEILFRTGARYCIAARLAVVGFQADDIDPRTRTGWSVLGVGHTYEVVDPERLATLADALPEAWAPGRTAHVIAIALQHLTGRRLRRNSATSGRDTDGR